MPILLLALLLLSAALLSAPSGEAFAAGTPLFLIENDGEGWRLYLVSGSERTLQDSSTESMFFENDEGSESDSPALQFQHYIKAWLEDNELSPDDYNLSFGVMPAFDAECSGEEIIKYSVSNDGDFCVFSDTVTSVMKETGTNIMTGTLQYRTADGEYGNQFHNYTQKAGTPLFFGRSQDVGEYFVRYVASEQIYFDNKTYVVPRYSRQEFHCEVIPDYAPIPDLKAASIEYGTAAKDIVIPDISGTWTLSADQQISPNARLEVSDQPYTVYFDYVANNANYLPLERLPVQITVDPTRLIVFIGNLSSIKGEPLADLSTTDYFLDGLVEGDAVNDLGLEFYLFNEDFDPNVDTFALILARITDKNYYVECRNIDSDSVLNGGRYTVYQYRYDATAADGRKFSVLCDSLNDVTLQVEISSEAVSIATDAPEGVVECGYRSVAIYSIIFYDASGTRQLPSAAYDVEWEGKVEGAQYLAFAAKEQLASLTHFDEYDGTQNKITLSPSQDSIMFLTTYVVYPPENVWQWYNILLVAILGASALALAAVAICIARRRSRIWR